MKGCKKFCQNMVVRLILLNAKLFLEFTIWVHLLLSFTDLFYSITLSGCPIISRFANRCTY